MAKWGSCDFSELKKFKEKLEKLSKANIQKFCEDVSRELAARLLSKAIKRTPVGDYSGESYTCVTGKSHKGSKKIGMVGGTLRRGWTAGKKQSANSFVETIPIKHIGNIYQIDVTNVVDYASYVEFGHRTRNHKGWVEGHFMLTISEQELNAVLPKLIQTKLNEFLKEVF